MKKTITTLFLFCVFIVNAQVTEIFVPNTYSIGSNYGATVPFFQKDGFIYTISQNYAGGSYGKIFKINQTTNQVIQLLDNANFQFYDQNGIPRYIGEFNEKFFFLCSNGSYVLNTIDNTFNQFLLGGTYADAVYNGYYYNYSNKINISTGNSTPVGTTTYTYNGTTYNTPLVGSYYNIANDLYLIHSEYSEEWGNTVPKKIYKFLDSNSPLLIYTLPSGLINTLWGNNLKLFKLGNKLIFNTMATSGTVSNLVGLTDSGTLNTITTSNTPSITQQLDQFIYNGNLYYYENTDNSFMKVTDGTSANITAIANPAQYGNNNFSSWYYPSKNFIEYQGNMYSLKYGASNDPRYFIKYDGSTITNLTAELTDVQSAIIHNNIMYFKGGYLINGTYNLGIFSFDGNTIRKLDLGTTIPNVALNSSLYGYNNYLFFGNEYCLVKVDLNIVSSTVFTTNLSTQSFITQKSTFSPNPTTSNITFSQEIRGLEIFDITGKKVKSFQNTATTFNVEELEKGVYLLKGKSVNDNYFTEKLVKE